MGFLKELGDAAGGAAIGYVAGREMKRDWKERQAAKANSEPAYKNGGYVAARASGKRDYPKGKR